MLDKYLLKEREGETGRKTKRMEGREGREEGTKEKKGIITPTLRGWQTVPPEEKTHERGGAPTRSGHLCVPTLALEPPDQKCGAGGRGLGEGAGLVAGGRAASSGPAPPGRPRPTRQLAWAPAPLCSDLAAAPPGWEAGRISGRSGASAAPGAASNELRNPRP